MPEESINIFISNIYAIAIFTGIFAVIFMVLFLISRVLIHRSKKIDTAVKDGGKSSYEIQHQDRQTGSMVIIRRDIYLVKNLFIAGLLFIFIIFFIILMMLSFLFATDFSMEGSLYMIFALIFLILVITVYIMKSKILER